MIFAIERFRKKANISQVELAKKLGVTQGAISQWEKGIAVPQANKLPEIAKILNCSVDELVNARRYND